MYFVVRGWQRLKCRLTFVRQRAKVVKAVPGELGTNYTSNNSAIECWRKRTLPTR